MPIAVEQSDNHVHLPDWRRLGPQAREGSGCLFSGRPAAGQQAWVSGVGPRRRRPMDGRGRNLRTVLPPRGCGASKPIRARGRSQPSFWKWRRSRSPSGPSNYYELLGVHPSASTEEVKRAFFSKSKELHPDRDPGNPTLHSRFVELSEAYQVLSHAESRRNYDLQLRSATAPTPGASGPRGAAHQAYRGAWEDPNSRYWAQFRGVRPQGPEERRRQQKLNQRVMGYCLLVMLAGMGLHYVAFRKLEQMHRSFMDEKDRIITAIYNEARARAKKARLQKEPPQNQQPPPGPVPGPEVVRPGSSP
ncbi:dnaJ homolog subfamily C member 4 isoform X4 [Sorex araneus]|uniref:dnaJ homolog subfamily C member 4 isoform X4 n=1 Tax=Sorex araneus TaxID=42254 RepID=UPI0024339806|nr:dnaJ homolog subfamily C member 4 isoform X4 [Sorex araneus]